MNTVDCYMVDGPKKGRIVTLPEDPYPTVAKALVVPLEKEAYLITGNLQQGYMGKYLGTIESIRQQLGAAY